MEQGPVARFAAQPLLDSLSRPGRYRFARVGHGAQILAVSESALQDARAALARLYGPLVRFGEPWIAPHGTACEGQRAATASGESAS